MQGGVVGVDSEDLALALWSMIERFNYYRHTRATGLTDDAAVDNLAVVAQLIVFPETPSALLAVRDHSMTLGRDWAQAAAVFEARPDWRPRAGRFASLSDQAFTTVRDLLDAGARLLATSGYHDTSVNKIVREAGRSRGTFYKYFDGKLDLLLTLARECAENIRELSDRLGRVGTSGELRAWLADFLALHETHSGVFRVWLEQVVDDPAVRETSTVAIGSALAGITGLLSRVERAYTLDLGASALMVLGLLERLPDQPASGHARRATDGPAPGHAGERDGAGLPQLRHLTDTGAQLTPPRPVIGGRSKTDTTPGSASHTSGMALIARMAVMLKAPAGRHRPHGTGPRSRRSVTPR